MWVREKKQKTLGQGDRKVIERERETYIVNHCRKSPRKECKHEHTAQVPMSRCFIADLNAYP